MTFIHELASLMFPASDKGKKEEEKGKKKKKR